jgi:protein-tyrosine-phosphatase
VSEKYLYVCKNNVGRSQMAMTIHNLEKPGTAESAGVEVDEPGGLVKDWRGGPEAIMAAMEEIGLPIGENSRTQYTDDLAKKFGRVIFILTVEQIPDYIDLEEDRVIYWAIDDPHHMSIEDTRLVRAQIEKSTLAMIRTDDRIANRALLPQVCPYPE